MPGLRGDAAIVGVAEFAPQRKPDRAWMGLEAQAELARLALDDAGIPLGDVDGVMTQAVLTEAPFLVPSTLVEYLGVGATFAEVVDLGGATACGMAARAAMAIEAGYCETVVCITDMTYRHPDPRQAGQDWGADWGGGVWGSPQAEFEMPFGAVQGTYGYAMIANRYAYEYGLDPRHLAKIAVDQRTNALAHPKAIFKQAITIEDVLNSPVICDPLHLLEVVMPCFGGAAFVVTSRDRAAKSRHRPVYILGAGEYTTHRSVTYEPSFTTSPIKVAADRAWTMSGLSPADIDVAALYDCYTITVLLTLEDAGFCAKGEGGRFIAAHDFTYRGDFPVNTHGGQLSFGQAGGAGGTSQVVEAVLQVQGRAGARQLRHCDTAYINGNGGIMSEQVSLVVRGA